MMGISSGPDRWAWLRSFPNTAVGISLGLGGQAILWKALCAWPLLDGAAGFVEAVQWAFWVACAAALALFAGIYAAKCVRHREVMWAEYYHPVRANFFCGPCISLCFIALALPPSLDGLAFQQAAWTLAFFYQSLAALVIYRRWLYDTSTSDLAAAPYLMSVVPWFLLSALSSLAEIDVAAGLPLAAMCFGVGALFTTFLYPFVLLGIHCGRTVAGSPPLFLMLASPSAAGMALIPLTGGISAASEALFGMVLFLFCLLLCNKPSLMARPAVLGVYWAYVFPASALAALAVLIAADRQTLLADVIAVALAAFAVVTVAGVFVRMSAHQYLVCMGKDVWSDPVVLALDKRGIGATDAATELCLQKVRSAVKSSSSGCGEDSVEPGTPPVPPAAPSELEQRLCALEAELAAQRDGVSRDAKVVAEP